jgi:putative oxidoreductase
MSEDVGKLVLRLMLGILIVLHGIAKLQHGIDFIVGTVTQAGLPAFVAYGVYVGEVLAPLLVIVGFYSRIGAALIALNMLFAIALVHAGEVFMMNPQSGGWQIETQALFLFTAIAVALAGPGRFSINAK